MIQHVYERACESDALRVLVATDDQRIADAVSSFGGNVMLTSTEHLSGTDRLREVAANLDLDDQQIVVNVQGDEPLIPAEVINQVARNLAERTDFDAATLCEPIDNIEDFTNPAAVKVVSDINGTALYFSRAPLPWPRDAFAENRSVLPASVRPMRHIGIYAYRVGLLHRFVSWSASTLEQVECLEQLRILENGGRIHVEEAANPVPAGIDTEQDLFRVRALLEG